MQFIASSETLRFWKDLFKQKKYGAAFQKHKIQRQNGIVDVPIVKREVCALIRENVFVKNWTWT